MDVSLGFYPREAHVKEWSTLPPCVDEKWNINFGILDYKLCVHFYTVHPAAVNAASAAVLYPLKKAGIATFSFLRAAICFAMLSYLALRLAQALAVVLDVEEAVLLDFAAELLVATVLESASSAVVFDVIVSSVVFLALGTWVVVGFTLGVVIGLETDSEGLGFPLLDTLETVGLLEVLVVAGSAEPATSDLWASVTVGGLLEVLAVVDLVELDVAVWVVPC